MSGANIREAFYAHGRADFIAKLQIALKECSESEYWLELLIESGYYHDRKIGSIEYYHKYWGQAMSLAPTFMIEPVFVSSRNHPVNQERKSSQCRH